MTPRVVIPIPRFEPPRWGELDFLGTQNPHELHASELVSDLFVALHPNSNRAFLVVELRNLVEDHHLKELSYLDAVVKEAFRLHLIIIQREAIHPCTIGGYAIPKKAKVMVNAWAIHMDPQLWEEPF
ncbi:unnamed protein product [Linum tenue]|uniref:Cytochrome P450 n=1 Tax=Linum tenue TaxID=586396 RepID=A0AAV0KZ09_9ROSI|nr:unnamed protein product [Linum tenue]